MFPSKYLWDKSNPDQTRYEAFTASFAAARQNDTVNEWQKPLIDNGTYQASKLVKELSRLQSRMCGPMLIYLFGEQLGGHLAEKFVNQCGRNLLAFLPLLTDEYRFFLLHEMHNNPEIWIYG